MALEWNDFGNAARAPAVKDECARFGLVFTIWLTRPFDAQTVRQAVVESGAAGVILEGEIPAHRPEAVNWPAVIFELSDLDVAKAVVTNFAPFVHEDGTPWPEKAAPLVADSWACMTENYLSEAPNATLEATADYAKRVLGWPETQPVLGLYGGKTFADYPTRNQYRNWSVWDAGEVL